MNDPFPKEAEWYTARRAGGRVILALLLVVGVVAGAWFVWGVFPSLPDGPLVARRGADGAFTVDQPVDAAGPAARATALKGNINVTTRSTTSRSGNASLRARSIAVFLESEHLLAQRVGFELFQKLQKVPRFDEVRYFPHGERFPDGEMLPDLYMTIAMPEIDERGAGPMRNLDATFAVTLGDRLRRSSNHYQSTFTPPAIQFHSTVTFNYSAKEIGIETAAARYEAISRELAESISKNITEHLDTLAADNGDFRTTPEEFLPAYAPPPAFPFLKEVAAEQVLTGHGFMHSNRTVWQVPAVDDPGEFLEMIAEALKADEWSAESLPEGDRSEVTFFRAVRRGDAEIIEVFVPQSVMQTNKTEGKGAVRPDWQIAYFHSMTEPEIAAALQSVLERDIAESELAPFAGFFWVAPEAVDEYFNRHPPQLVESMAHLARVAIRRNDEAAAKRLVLRAGALQRILHHASAPSGEIKTLAKELGIEELPKLPDLDVLEPGDLIDARETLPDSARVPDGRTLILLLRSGADRQVFLTLTPQFRADGHVSMRRQDITLGEQSSSWGETGAGNPFLVPRSEDGSGQPFKVAWQPLNDSGEVEFMFTETP